MMRTSFWSPGNLLALLVAVAAIGWLAIPNSARYNIKEVSIPEAKALIDAGAVVVDVRPKDKYEGRHIPGAVSLPLEILKQSIPGTFLAAKTEPIVVYCGEGTSLGPEGTLALNRAGYSGAVNLKSGISGWADSGLPVQKSP